MPFTMLLSEHGTNPFGNQLDDLTLALQHALRATEESRRYNRERLQRKANAGHIEVGDTVIVKAEVRDPLTSRWDTQYEVIRVSGPVVKVRHQVTNKVRTLHRTKVKIVDPNISRDKYRPRCQTDPARPTITQFQIKRRAPRQGCMPAGHGIGQVPPAPAANYPSEPGHIFWRKRREISSPETGKRPRLDVTTRNFSQRGRPLNLSARAREAVNDHCAMEADPVISHFRKRKLTESPLSTREQKIAKCEAVVLVSLFTA